MCSQIISKEIIYMDSLRELVSSHNMYVSRYSISIRVTMSREDDTVFEPNETKLEYCIWFGFVITHWTWYPVAGVCIVLKTLAGRNYCHTEQCDAARAIHVWRSFAHVNREEEAARKRGGSPSTAFKTFRVTRLAFRVILYVMFYPASVINCTPRVSIIYV